MLIIIIIIIITIIIIIIIIIIIQLYNNCKIGQCPSLLWHSFHLIPCLGQWHLSMREEQ